MIHVVQRTSRPTLATISVFGVDHLLTMAALYRLSYGGTIHVL